MEFSCRGRSIDCTAIQAPRRSAGRALRNRTGCTTMTFNVQSLNVTMRNMLLAHFLALPIRDRWLRFGAPLAPAVIAAYVDGIDFARDVVFGAHDDRLALVGVAHLAVQADSAELALSVLPAHRGRGIGAALFERAVAHARNRRIPRLVMRYRRNHAPVVRIVQRFGMHVVAGGIDADAHLELQPASLASSEHTRRSAEPETQETNSAAR